MKGKTDSVTQLADLKEVNTDAKENGQTKIDEPVSIADKIRSVFSFFTVEPFLLCYILPSIIMSLAVQKLNIEKACRVDLNYLEDICDQVVYGNFTEDDVAQVALDEAHVMVARMTTWSQPLATGIPAIMILFVGAWSDRTGNRKALMLIPIIGEFVSVCGLMLATYFFLEWPLWVTALIESLPSALSGGLSIALMGSYSYIADVTTIDSRTFRIGLVAVIVTLGVPLGSSISGVLTQAVGYYGVFGIGMALYAIGFTHTYFRVHNVRNTITEGTCKEKLALFFHPKNVWDTISILFMSRGKQLLKIVLVIWAHIVIIGPVFGEAPVMFLYANKKFKMDIVDFSYFQTYSTIMGLVGTTIAITLFSKFLKMHDALLGLIATASKVSSSLVYAFSLTTTWLYLAPVFDIFGNSGVTAIRSLGTKVVEPNQVGKFCSLIGFVEAVVPVIYTPIYSTVYVNNATTFPGMFYVVGGVMTAPDFFIFITLYIIYKKEQRDVVKTPAEKEMHAHDNAITAL